MKIYVDENYKCHLSPAEGLRAFEVPELDGKCSRFIQGFRYVPKGETWTRSDGEIFSGEMLAAHEDFALLHSAQQVYDSLSPQISELRERLSAIRECIEGLSFNPGLEQLLDFINTIREMMEDFDA